MVKKEITFFPLLSVFKVSGFEKDSWQDTGIQDTGYKCNTLLLSCSLHKPCQSLGRNHIHYSFPYMALGRHKPHLWASACLSLYVWMCVYIIISEHINTCELVCVQLWSCTFIYLKMCMFVTICRYVRALCIYVCKCVRMGVGGGFIATCYSWRRLLQCAAVWGRFPVEPLWSYSLSGTASEDHSWTENTSTHLAAHCYPKNTE